MRKGEDKRTALPKILIIFSNPRDTTRLRLDKEHRAIEALFTQMDYDRSFIHIRHATTSTDLSEALNLHDYEIVQFSGHASDQGIILENETSEDSRLLDIKKLASLLKVVPSPPRIIILMSCYSSQSAAELIQIAPYIISMKGEADDQACIEFIRQFYSKYFQTRSVGLAFEYACTRIEVFEHSEKFFPTILRRGKLSNDLNRIFVPSFPHLFYTNAPDGLIIDISPVEDAIRSTGMSRDKFMSILSRKIRIHTWIFSFPRDNALLQVGSLFGLFSWKSVDDPVVCLQLRRLRSEADQEVCKTWAGLLLSYNEDIANKYRYAEDPVSPILEKSIKKSLDELQMTFDFYLKNEERAKLLQSTAKEEFKLSFSFMSAYLERADRAFYSDDLAQAMINIEGALTSLHDLVDALSEKLTEEL